MKYSVVLVLSFIGLLIANSGEAQNSNDICKNEVDGTYLADPDDCSKYYECLRGEALHEQCGAGTLWNESIETCDYPANVNCTVSSTVPPTTEAPPTTITPQTTEAPPTTKAQ